jgi:hypothetical protein
MLPRHNSCSLISRSKAGRPSASSKAARSRERLGAKNHGHGHTTNPSRRLCGGIRALKRRPLFFQQSDADRIEARAVRPARNVDVEARVIQNGPRRGKRGPSTRDRSERGDRRLSKRHDVGSTAPFGNKLEGPLSTPRRNMHLHSNLCGLSGLEVCLRGGTRGSRCVLRWQ